MAAFADIEAPTEPPPQKCCTCLPCHKHGQPEHDHVAQVRTKGTQVYTAFGAGVVKLYRVHDDMVVVELAWGAVMYAQPTEISTTMRKDNKNGKRYPQLTLGGSVVGNQYVGRRFESAYVEKYTILGVFQLMLFSNWLLCKAWCAAGIPADCQTNGLWASAGVLEDFQAMFLMGSLLAYLCNINKSSRFWAIFTWKRWYFFVCFYLSGLLFGVIGKYVSFSFSSGGCCTPSGYAVLLIGGAFVVGAIVYHIYFAWTRFSRVEFTVYVVSRLGFFGFYFIIMAIVLANDDLYSVHVHHYLVAYALATFCCFDHWVSLTMLAICLGVFCQGLAAYDYASLFDLLTNCAYLIRRMPDGSSVRVPSYIYLLSSTSESFRTNYCVSTSTGEANLTTPEGLYVNGMPW